jgi:hypothetical protein
MEFPNIVFIFVATLALILVAASLPRGLLAVAFFAAVAAVVSLAWRGAQQKPGWNRFSRCFLGESLLLR